MMARSLQLLSALNVPPAVMETDCCMLRRSCPSIKGTTQSQATLPCRMQLSNELQGDLRTTPFPGGLQ